MIIGNLNWFPLGSLAFSGINEQLEKNVDFPRLLGFFIRVRRGVGKGTQQGEELHQIGKAKRAGTLYT